MGQHGIDQVLLQVLLLQVGHGEEAVVLAVRCFHAKHALAPVEGVAKAPDRKSTRLNSSHLVISYAVFCLKKKRILLQPRMEPASASDTRWAARRCWTLR